MSFKGAPYPVPFPKAGEAIGRWEVNLCRVSGLFKRFGLNSSGVGVGRGLVLEGGSPEGGEEGSPRKVKRWLWELLRVAEGKSCSLRAGKLSDLCGGGRWMQGGHGAGGLGCPGGSCPRA